MPEHAAEESQLQLSGLMLGGIRIASVTRSDLKQYLLDACRSADSSLRSVGYINAHVFNQCWKHPGLARILGEADLVYADGVSARWGARLTGQKQPERITAADWFDQLLVDLAVEKVKIFLVGGAPGVTEKFVEHLKKMGFPEHCIAGSHHGYAKGEEAVQLVERISKSGADLLVLGMGTPWQEAFYDQHKKDLQTRAVWWIGAAMEYYTGNQWRGPDWTRKLGHEWLGRLFADPFRLAGRYLIGNPLFLLRVLARSKPPVGALK